MLVDDEVDGVKSSGAAVAGCWSADLLSNETRPFVYFQNCTNHWREPNRKAQLETRLLQPGETMTAKIVATRGQRCRCSKPVIRKVDAPRLLITDHADQTTAGTLHALAGGIAFIVAALWQRRFWATACS